MKKIIYLLGILSLAVITIINIVFTANLDASEHIVITQNSIIYIMGLVLLGILIFMGTRKLDEYLYKNQDDERKKKIRKRIFITTFSIYIIFNIAWIIFVRPGIVGDQIHVCNLAQTFFRNNVEEFLPNLTYARIPLSEYIQAYQQQIPLAFVFSIFFRIIHFDGIGLLRILNVIGNIGIVVALYKITKQLSKKYKTNVVMLFTLIFTFIPLPMLSTFIYGDTPSLALCLFSVYFMMKYTKEKAIKYPIYACICTMVAYMMRMNSLIFIIATVIYLLLNLFKEIVQDKNWKKSLLSFGIIIAYVIISIFPTTLIENYYLSKYDLDKDKKYPTVSFILIAMEESWRGNGWYNEDIGEKALREPENVKEEYKDRIKERLNYFAENPAYTIDFYTKKITSMWAENTYSAVRSNLTKENDPMEKITMPLLMYQKTLLLIICITSIIVLIQNRKNISLDIIFLLTIFIGGFAFHILWEAKSRYIIPYIIILIPIASIAVLSKKQEKTGVLDGENNEE